MTRGRIIQVYAKEGIFDMKSYDNTSNQRRIVGQIPVMKGF